MHCARWKQPSPLLGEGDCFRVGESAIVEANITEITAKVLEKPSSNLQWR